AAAREALSRQRAQLDEATAAARKAEADGRALQIACATLTAAQGDADGWAEVHRLGTDLVAAEDRSAELRQRWVTVRAVEQDAREAFLVAQQARIDGMAAELAAKLVDGEPCAVC